MPVYYFLYLIILIVILLFLLRFSVLKSRPRLMQLYRNGLKAENNGHFDEATAIYENALFELKKIRFHHLLKKKTG